MDKLDELIAQALENEDKDILAQTEEPGYFTQAIGVFTGRTGWTSWVIMLVQTVMFFAGIWASWHFFQAAETLAALKWGLPAATLLLMAGMLKFTLMPVMQANRVIREIKRLELLLARSKSD